MGDEGIKSALEIAMERISGLPELTPEEIAEQKEKEFRPLGEALASKYMQGVIAETEIPAEIARHAGEPGEIVRRAFVAFLCRSVRPDDPGAAVRALNGLCRLAGDAEGLREKTTTAWSRILDDFQKRKDKILLECEATEMEKLGSLGISGSALRPNMADNESLKNELDALRRSCEPELEKLRAVLLESLLGG
ncbi:MAG: hypothetical protein JW793_03300 [Acidobacteria bacterium]|nr:hypothetical protein [Acidobacteriota bacterium]